MSLTNVSAKNIDQALFDKCQAIRKEKGFTNHEQLLQFLMDHYEATKGKKPEPAAAKPATGDGYFTVKLNSRDVEPLQKVRDHLFEKNMENDSQVLRYLVRQELQIVSKKAHLIKLPENTNKKLMGFYEKGRRRGNFRDTSDAIKQIIKEADDYDLL